MNLFNSIRGDVTTTGIDIGNHSIKLAKIKHTKDEFFLEAVGIKDLEKGIIEGGVVKKKDALIDALTTLVEQCDPSIVDVVFSISGDGILSEKFNFKIDPTEELSETILMEASQKSPFDADDITIDYKVLREIPEKDEVEVLLVAAKNDIMQSYIDLLYEAGLRPVIVDVDVFAITNSYSLESVAENSDGVVALLNVGHASSNVVFLKNGIYHSARTVGVGCGYFITTISRNMNISVKEAEDALKGNFTEDMDVGMLERTIEYSLDELASGLDIAVSYFKNVEKDSDISKIVVSGGGAYLSGLNKFLEERYDTVVVTDNPLGFLNYEPGLFGVVNPQQISAYMSVAVGLALRKVDL